MQKPRPVDKHIWKQGKSTPIASGVIYHCLRKTKSIRSLAITKLIPIILLLTQASFRPRPQPQRKTNIMGEVEAIQLLESMPPRFQKKTIIKIRSKKT